MDEQANNDAGDAPEQQENSGKRVVGVPFVKGDPRINRDGRPKGTSLTDRLRAIVEADDGKVGEALMKTAAKAALKGDWRFWNSIVERLEGKVPSSVDLTSGGKAIKGYAGFNPEEDV